LKDSVHYTYHRPGAELKIRHRRSDLICISNIIHIPKRRTHKDVTGIGSGGGRSFHEECLCRQQWKVAMENQKILLANGDLEVKGNFVDVRLGEPIPEKDRKQKINK